MATRLYDLMLLLDPEAPEERRDEILDNVQHAIETSGTVVGVHDWGQRKMAFEIDKKPDAAYHLIQFEGDNELLESLDHSLKISDGVLRFRTIRLKPGSPPPPTPRSDPPRRREESEGAPVAASRAAADAPPRRERQ